MIGKNWTRFNKYLYKYWKLQAVVILLGTITVPLGLVNPYLTKLVIDKAYGNKDTKLFIILAIIGGAIFVVNGIVNSVESYLSKRINSRVNLDMTKDLFKHIQELSLSFFDNHSTGEHIYRINSDARAVAEFVCNTIPQAIMLFPRLIFILAIVFYLNWKLALFAAMLVPIGYIHPYLFGKWARDMTSRMILKAQGIFQELQEVFSHIRLIKAFGKETREVEKFEKSITQEMNAELVNSTIYNIAGLSRAVLNKVLSGAIALYGGYQVIKGTMTLGSLTAIMIYLAQLMGLLGSVGNFLQTLAVSSVTRDRLAEMLDIKPAILDSPDARDHVITKGSVEFRNIYFGYKLDYPVLDGINFCIQPGCKVALVGPSGYGKTTILSLILRLYEPEAGAILIDNIDIRKIKLACLKSQIGIVMQEPSLWNDTIANNILYGAETNTSGRDEVIAASKLAEAHGFITKLANGYDSSIGEMACKLSEGQKQRIAIARTLIKKPGILLMDEALSSLDSETEEKIIENIKYELPNSTVITVSHRLSTVRKMDRIIFLEGNSRIEVGTHESLLERNPGYRELFASQVDDSSKEKVFT